MVPDRVIVNIENEIAFVRLNRPEKLNAFDLPMFQAISRAIKHLRRDKKVRVVILSGAGEDFSSGLDVNSVFASPITPLKLLWKVLPGSANLAQQVSVGWQRLPVPVIAAIRGRCWGAAMQVALGCDFRIAHPDASLAVMEAKWGLIPDMGGNYPLSRLLCADQALTLSLLAEPVSGETAQSINLVSESHAEPLQRALALANAIKEKSPDALAGIKMLSVNAERRQRRKMLALETYYQIKNIMTKNQRIAVKRARGQNTTFVARKSWR